MADALADRVDAWLRGEAPKPLTRRERAALTLALEVLRRSVGEDRRWKSGILAETHVAWRAISDGARRNVFAGVGDVEPRVIRARLALWLRARLRADRGDCGPCEHGVGPHRVRLTNCPPWCFGSRRITPLWQRAGEVRR